MNRNNAGGACGCEDATVRRSSESAPCVLLPAQHADYRDPEEEQRAQATDDHPRNRCRAALPAEERDEAHDERQRGSGQ